MKNVLYHAGCSDGFCAAWLCNKAWPEANYVPVQYGEDPADVSGPTLIVDVSYPRDVLESLYASLDGRLTVLDHHETAKDQLAGLPYCVFDMEKSGARLTWEFLCDLQPDFPSRFPRGASGRGVQDGPFTKTYAPWIVDYTEDRDLWRWNLPGSKELNAGLRSYPLEFSVWNGLYSRATIVEDLILEGQAILREQQKLIDQHVGFAGEIQILGYRVLAVNATCHASEIAGKLAEGRPFGVVWFESAEGKRVFSLRSRDGGMNVAELAKRLGGGGHPKAAGFALDSGEWPPTGL